MPRGRPSGLPPSASAAGFSAKPPRRATPCWPRRAAGPTRRVRGSSPQPGRRPKGEREAILQDARHQVALLSIAITEKMLRERLDDEASQTRLAEKMLDEMESRSERKEA